MTPRIGFCCKALDDGGQTIPELNFRATTVAWLNRQPKDGAVARLWEILDHNLQATRNLIQTVGTWDPGLRMVRIGSDMLPVYTHPSWSWFWRQPDVQTHISKSLSNTGELARKLDVRLSFHPGQFCVIASDNPDIVQRSIEELEYHVDMARWMGYGASWHDHGFKINVHVAGRNGPGGIRVALPRLSPEARNLLTIENEENRWGLDSILELEKDVALVLDIHHHFINSGEYIQPQDDRVQRILGSWRGVRPTMHYSLSREDILVDHHVDQLPNLQRLLESGHKRAKLRAHSDYMWNRAANDWALEFLPHADIQVESKMKNLASRALHQYMLDR